MLTEGNSCWWRLVITSQVKQSSKLLSISSILPPPEHTLIMPPSSGTFNWFPPLIHGSGGRGSRSKPKEDDDDFKTPERKPVAIVKKAV